MIEIESQAAPMNFHQLVEEYNNSRRQFPLGMFPAWIETVGHLGNDITFYNPSSPFRLIDEEGSPTYQFFRVEPISCEGSYAVPYKHEHGIYKPMHEIDRLRLEDPTVERIKGKNILIGVKVWPDRTLENPNGTNYCNEFYEIIGNFDDYKLIARGPNRMKGTKLIDLGDEGIGVMTRPHIDQDFRGVLAFQIIKSLEELTHERLLNGQIITNQVALGNWIGVNELYLLPNGRVGVLGHIAYEDARFKKYYAAMVFQYDPKTHLTTPIKVIATVDDFKEFEPKTSLHAGVMYPSALLFRNYLPLATLLLSLGDAQYGGKRILNPW